MKFVILVHRWRQSYAEVYTKDTKKEKFQFHRYSKRQYFKKKDKEKKNNETGSKNSTTKGRSDSMRRDSPGIIVRRECVSRINH